MARTLFGYPIRTVLDDDLKMPKIVVGLPLIAGPRGGQRQTFGAIWMHWQLNSLVLTVGRWPLVGRLVWFLFGQWQRVM